MERATSLSQRSGSDPNRQSLLHKVKFPSQTEFCPRSPAPKWGYSLKTLSFGNLHTVIPATCHTTRVLGRMPCHYLPALRAAGHAVLRRACATSVPARRVSLRQRLFLPVCPHPLRSHLPRPRHTHTRPGRGHGHFEARQAGTVCKRTLSVVAGTGLDWYS